MHGPNHLFCTGCDMADDALTCSAWAGYFAAHGKVAESDKWAQAATDRAGKLMLRTSGGDGSWVEVRMSGDLDAELCDEVIEIARIMRARSERVKKAKAIEAEKTLVAVSESTEKEGTI